MTNKIKYEIEIEGTFIQFESTKNNLTEVSVVRWEHDDTLEIVSKTTVPIWKEGNDSWTDRINRDYRHSNNKVYFRVPRKVLDVESKIDQMSRKFVDVRMELNAGDLAQAQKELHALEIMSVEIRKELDLRIKQLRTLEQVA